MERLDFIHFPEYVPQGFAGEIFRKRYTRHEGETWAEACERVAGHVALAEHDVPMYRALFSEVLRRNLFMPGGRIWYGSGRPKGQLLNCFVIPTSDSREGWGKTVSDMIVIAGTGGGVGINCSPVRPRGSTINGSGGVATGAVSLMEIINAAGEVIKAGGGRRTALMLCLGLSHGDLQEFLDKKLDLAKLNNANVSVWFDEDPEDFFRKVRAGEDLDLTFRNKVVGRIPAREVWDRLVDNALRSGEPGLLNGYLFNRMSNISYHSPIISTNPCGEIGLLAHDCCCLGAVVLPRFVRGDKVDWAGLSSVVRLGVRFLDDVLTVNNYPLPEIKETCSNVRRIGLGVMGLHDMLLLLGHRYNSDEGLEFVDQVLKFVKNEAYEESVELAREKGSFPKFVPELFLKGGFAKTLKPSLRSKIKEHGIRNCAILTIAPTGTTSMVSGVTSGIEPMFAPAYLRRFRDGDELRTETVIHPLLKEFTDDGKDVSHFQGAFDLRLRDHFEMQRTCQRHLDNACSKTINLPQGTSREELSELFMEFFPELKGVTVYPEGSREDQPLTPMSLDEAIKHMTGHETLQAYAQDPCRSGKCDL
jgi:ribonucleoside-diphosphate reductase alpha chain